MLFARFLQWNATPPSPPPPLFHPVLCKRVSLCRAHTAEVENNSPPPPHWGDTSNIHSLEFFCFVFILSFIISMWTHGYLLYILHHLHTVLFLLLPKWFQFWLLGQMLAPVSLCYLFITSLLSDTYKMLYLSLLLMIVFSLEPIFVLCPLACVEDWITDRDGEDNPGLYRWTLNTTTCVFIRGGKGRFDTQRRRWSDHGERNWLE